MRSHPHKVLCCDKTCVSVSEKMVEWLNGGTNTQLSYIVPQSERLAKREGVLCSSYKGRVQMRKENRKVSSVRS